MNNRRNDICPTLTLFGHTLWSWVPNLHMRDLSTWLKDVDGKVGIWDRTALDHNEDHAYNLA